MLGYSFLIHKLMARIFPEYWYQGFSYTNKAHTQGEWVACALFKKIESLLKKTSEPPEFYLLIQCRRDEPTDHLEMVDRVLACVKEDPIQKVDLRTVFSELQLKDKEAFDKMFRPRGHMSPKGNYLIARILADRMTNESLD